MRGASVVNDPLTSHKTVRAMFKCFHTPRKYGRVGNLIIVSRSQEIWEWYLQYLHWFRKSGPIVFSRSQEIWKIKIYTGSSKIGKVVFTRSQEIWASGINCTLVQKIWTNVLSRCLRSYRTCVLSAANLEKVFFTNIVSE